MCNFLTAKPRTKFNTWILAYNCVSCSTCLHKNLNFHGHPRSINRTFPLCISNLSSIPVAIASTSLIRSYSAHNQHTKCFFAEAHPRSSRSIHFNPAKRVEPNIGLDVVRSRSIFTNGSFIRLRRGRAGAHGTPEPCRFHLRCTDRACRVRWRTWVHREVRHAPFRGLARWNIATAVAAAAVLFFVLEGPRVLLPVAKENSRISRQRDAWPSTGC